MFRLLMTIGFLLVTFLCYANNYAVPACVNVERDTLAAIESSTVKASIAIQDMQAKGKVLQVDKKFYYCEYCGAKYTTVASLTNGSCARHANGSHKGKHKLYEGSEKLQYVCKLCGSKFPTLSSLTNGSCAKHAQGPHKGKHSPAM